MSPMILVVSASIVAAIIAAVFVITRSRASRSIGSPAHEHSSVEDRSSPSDEEVKEEWDFYLCKVDDAPASIFLDLDLVNHVPLDGADTLYAVQIWMAEPAEHGMGSAEEAEVLYPVEDGIEKAAGTLGIRSIGRLRNNGVWQITFMGPAALGERLESEVRQILEPTEHRFETVVQHDAEWGYYLEFLFPSPERLRWIRNRRVVDQLQDHGDHLSEPRRVEHWAYFQRPEERAAFVAEASEGGFTCEETEGGVGQLPLGVELHRVDPVDLEAIHKVVMLLDDLAAAHGGEYDGWGTSVERR